METGLYPQLLAWLHALWWPFVRVMALLTFAPVFGEGTVLQSEGVGLDKKLTVSFRGIGAKRLVARYAALEVL